MKKKFIAVLLLCIVAAFVTVGFFRNPMSLIHQADVVKIQNGTTGVIVTLTEAEGQTLINTLAEISWRIDGVYSWTLGYDYRLIFSTHGEEKSMTVRNHRLECGLFRYLTEIDLLQLLEDTLDAHI